MKRQRKRRVEDAEIKHRPLHIIFKQLWKKLKVTTVPVFNMKNYLKDEEQRRWSGDENEEMQKTCRLRKMISTGIKFNFFDCLLKSAS